MVVREIKKQLNLTKKQISESLKLKSIDDFMDYEDEIVGYFKAGRYHKMGGNGTISAILDWAKENKVDIDDDIDLGEVIDEMWWK